MNSSIFKILSLDGGGAKGVYTLGVLAELEAKLKSNLCDFFDLIYGVSTGSLIAALIGLGTPVRDIRRLYFENIPNVLNSEYPSPFIRRNANSRSTKLSQLAGEIFEAKKFDSFQTRLGIVATRLDHSRPMILKNSVDRAFSMKSSFSEGFGLSIAEAVVASCSAVPFFRPKLLSSESLPAVEVVDGGFSANNPSLFAMTDAVGALKKEASKVALLSIGTGIFPEPSSGLVRQFIKERELVRMLQLTLDASSKSMEQLTEFLFPTTSYLRINDEFADKRYAANLLETDLLKLNRLEQLGKESFGKHEKEVAVLWKV